MTSFLAIKFLVAFLRVYGVFAYKIVTIQISGSNGIWDAPSFIQTTTPCSLFVIKHYIKTGPEWHFGGSLLLTWECTHVLAAYICQHMPAYACSCWHMFTQVSIFWLNVSNWNFLGLQIWPYTCKSVLKLKTCTFWLAFTCQIHVLKFILQQPSKLYTNKIWY